MTDHPAILSDPALMTNVEGDKQMLARARALSAERNAETPGSPDSPSPEPGLPGRCTGILQCHQEAGHEGPHQAIALRDSTHEWRDTSDMSPDAMDWGGGHQGRVARLWCCPECQFGYDEQHVDEDGNHSCPVCALAAAKADFGRTGSDGAA